MRYWKPLRKVLARIGLKLSDGWLYDLIFNFLFPDDCQISFPEKKIIIDIALTERAISHFGVPAQLTVAIEEMAELTKELRKNIINHPNKSREKVVEEMADVQIMLEQVKIIFKITDFELQFHRDAKLERLSNTMDRRDS